MYLSCNGGHVGQGTFGSLSTIETIEGIVSSTGSFLFHNLKSVSTQYVERYSTYCVYPCLAFYTLAERQAKGNDKPIRTVAGHSILGLVLWLAVLERYAYYGAEKWLTGEFYSQKWTLHLLTKCLSVPGSPHNGPVLLI
ncbi:Aldo-keto reductase yakc [Fusarium oxysporum f. sp. albedinis]|nr:Aldo-keto reductase yakc [Fusarium oxysporum f. sp. albedinis]